MMIFHGYVKNNQRVYTVSQFPIPEMIPRKKTAPPSDDFIREILLNRPIGKDGKRRF